MPTSPTWTQASTRPTISARGFAPPSFASGSSARSGVTGGGTARPATTSARSSPKALSRAARRSPGDSASIRTTRSRCFPSWVPDVRFDRFYRYDELTEILQGWAEERSELVRVESIGSSFEGREIWLCTLTNFQTGPDLEKPAFLIEANIHSIEVTGTTAALHLIERLLSGHGDDERVTRLLDSRTFYVVPRLNPDGPELALAARPRFIRSSTRPWPLAEEVDGLHEEDLDGDGRILMMRMEDPNGSWKQHPDEPKLMVRREPDDADGEYYRVL